MAKVQESLDEGEQAAATADKADDVETEAPDVPAVGESDIPAPPADKETKRPVVETSDAAVVVVQQSGTSQEVDGGTTITGLTYQYPPQSGATQADLDTWALEAYIGRYPAGCEDAPPAEVLSTMKEPHKTRVKRMWRR